MALIEIDKNCKIELSPAKNQGVNKQNRIFPYFHTWALYLYVSYIINYLLSLYVQEPLELGDSLRPKNGLYLIFHQRS